MSAPQNHTSADAFRFYRDMTRSVPAWATAVDGISFHAYPNPGFSSPVTSNTRFSVRSYQHELKYLKSLRFSPKHIFITETGHLGQPEFYRRAFTEVFTEANIVAITPFLLFAGAGDFTGFSLLDPNHQPKSTYNELVSLPKVMASPLQNVHEPVISQSLTNPQITAPPAPATFFSRLKRLLYPRKKELFINDLSIQVEIADSPEETSQGLSGRRQLDDREGMLFIHSQPALYTYWMQDMNFGLDFIWIRNELVVELSRRVPPPSETGGQPTFITPKVTIDRVLEVPSGFIDKYGIKVGDSVKLI